VIRVPEPIIGTAFFPGGYGLWNPADSLPLPAFPVGGVMVLGHDFHSEAGYNASFARGHESSTQPTWRNLLPVLERSGISPTECFFTNVFMGLRAGTGTTGEFPGARNADFVDHCQKFLLSQIRALRPTLIVTLGIKAPEILGALSPQLLPWSAGPGLKHLDEAGPVRRDVQFSGFPGFSTIAVALVHPSLRSASVRHRRYKGLAGAKAEDLMLSDARGTTSFTDR
jgi:uracil-DNA glycosylase